MGYFSNGEEGMYYEEEFCRRCANFNEGGCTVLALHMLWNYEACNGKRALPESAEHTKYIALEMLIPRSRDGLSNAQCTMFLESK